jgi:hypothetical protein
MAQTKLMIAATGLLILNTVAASGSVRLSPTVSGVITLDPRGGGINDPSQTNESLTPRLFFTGYPEQLIRGFLYFDLTSVTEDVIAATIRFKVTELSTGTCCLGPAFGGVGLYEVTTTLESSRGDRWIDYGSGVSYGGIGLREDQDVGSVVEAQLSPTAVSNINASSEPFGIGVLGNTENLPSASLVTTEYELILDTTPAAIPEPQSLIIFAAYSLFGLLGCWLRVRCKASGR